MVGLLIAILRVYQVLVVIRALMSWLGPGERGEFQKLLFSLTEPFLAPLRRYTVIGNIDLSPVVLILAVEIVISILR